MEFRHSLLALLAVLLVTACAEPAADPAQQTEGQQSRNCLPGMVCPKGWKCAAAQPVCIQGDCGDGVLQAGEACDDGNVLGGDGCSLDCGSDETCGNGVADAPAGEACDDGNTTDGDGCSADCRSNELCGNGASRIPATKDSFSGTFCLTRVKSSI